MLTPKTPTSIMNSNDLPLVLFYGVLSALAESGVGNESRWAAPKARTADGYLWEHHALQINRRPGSELCCAELHQPEAFIWLNGLQVYV